MLSQPVCCGKIPVLTTVHSPCHAFARHRNLLPPRRLSPCQDRPRTAQRCATTSALPGVGLSGLPAIKYSSQDETGGHGQLHLGLAAAKRAEKAELYLHRQEKRDFTVAYASIMLQSLVGLHSFKGVGD